METKISSEEERNLTQAIESAATVASIDPSLDRSELLANHLNKAGVDKKFAKVASCAFNKRLTVLTFQQTDDEHKADSFALSDADAVHSYMGGTNSKQASYRPAFSISATPTTTMAKAASAKAPVAYGKKPLEDRLEYTDYLDTLEGILDKQAKCFQQINFDLESTEDKLEKLASELVHDYERGGYGFDFRTAVNYFGDAFTSIIKDKVPANVNLTKSASAIKLNNSTFAKIAKCIEMKDYIDASKQFIREYGAGLGQFAKAASDFSEAIRKAELDGSLEKVASKFGLVTGGISRAIPLYSMAATDAISTIGGTTADAARTGFGNAYDLFRSKDIDASPSKAIDAEFLLKDRMRDRMMAWSDMVADPQFAIYPSEQVFQATNKAMNTDTMMERSDKRELLRSTVAQLLAQNNRLGAADMAALATTIKGLSGGAGHAAGMAGDAVGAMDKVRAAEPIALNSIISKAKDNSSARTAMKENAKGLTDAIKDYSDGQSKAKDRAEREKELQYRKDQDDYRKQQDRRNREDRIERENKLDNERNKDTQYRRALEAYNIDVRSRDDLAKRISDMRKGVDSLRGQYIRTLTDRNRMENASDQSRFDFMLSRYNRRISDDLAAIRQLEQEYNNMSVPQRPQIP
jgi:hypothetical protein